MHLQNKTYCSTNNITSTDALSPKSGINVLVTDIEYL